MEHMTSEQYRQIVAKPIRKATKPTKPKQRSKYNNVITEIDGIKFDSKAEACRYEQLIKLQQAGVISALELQPPFELQAKFKGADGKMVRAITYRADFQYNENGRVVVEDVKGKETKDFIIKKKMFLQKYPHVDFRMIK